MTGRRSLEPDLALVRAAGRRMAWQISIACVVVVVIVAVLAQGLSDRLRANGFGVLVLTQAFGDLGDTGRRVVVVAGVPDGRVRLRRGVDAELSGRVEPLTNPPAAPVDT